MTEGAAAPEQQTSELRARSAAAADVVERVVANLERSVRAPHETLELCVLSLLAEGHVIIEDFPGVGKTVLAKSLARSLDLTFSRLQFTPDLLPSDVTGVNVFNQKTNEFEFRPGPVFANVLLVDEITPPGLPLGRPRRAADADDVRGDYRRDPLRVALRLQSVCSDRLTAGRQASLTAHRT